MVESTQPSQNDIRNLSEGITSPVLTVVDRDDGLAISGSGVLPESVLGSVQDQSSLMGRGDESVFSGLCEVTTSLALRRLEQV